MYRNSASVQLTPEQLIQFGVSLGMTPDQMKQAILELSSSNPDVQPSSDYFLPFADKDIPEPHQPTLAKYRAEARQQKVPDSVPLCYRVSAGFTLKEHAPQAGPCYQNFEYLQDWSFQDQPTRDSLVFWIPRIVPRSVKKNVSEQMEHLAKLRAKMELPAHHLDSFGNVAVVSGLVLAHFKATGERVPLDNYWVRTDTCLAGGRRLGLGWLEDSLGCGRWGWGDERYDDLGAFALGVEALGSSGT